MEALRAPWRLALQWLRVGIRLTGQAARLEARGHGLSRRCCREKSHSEEDDLRRSVKTALPSHLSHLQGTLRHEGLSVPNRLHFSEWGLRPTGSRESSAPRGASRSCCFMSHI